MPSCGVGQPVRKKLDGCAAHDVLGAVAQQGLGAGAPGGDRSSGVDGGGRQLGGWDETVPAARAESGVPDHLLSPPAVRFALVAVAA